MADHKFVSIPAREVVPYRYGVLYSIDGGVGHRVEGDRPDHFVNQIVRIKWSEDGEHLWFGLDSHNTMKVRPDEALELVPMEPRGMLAKKKADQWVLPPRPKPKKYLVLNGPHKGQWHPAHGGGTVLQLIDPTPPRRVRDLTDVLSPADTTYTYTTYALQTFGVEDGGKRDFHHFWQTQGTTRSATTMMDQLLDLVGKEDHSE